MAHAAIRVDKLTKIYNIRESEDEYRTFRDSLAQAARSLTRRPTRRSNREHRALNDVSFVVNQGDSVGIVGRNGAGKSTLLKVLSGITAPTEGRIEMRGRVASLLEVGTGFHPELTGRENIYLNGSILGMTRREIAARFDDIVEFSSVQKFLDTPVKRYSSGMRLRLAFAVAANLNPEIMVIDEVLAVGDALFQRRCIDRMSELSQSGCTLLFVSHNMEMVPVLCKNAIWLSDGRLVEAGDSHSVIDRYLGDLMQSSGDGVLDGRVHSGDGRARFHSLRIVDEAGVPQASIKSGRDVRCVVEIDSEMSVPNVSMAIVVKTLAGTRLITSWTDEVGYRLDITPGRSRIECCFRDVPIRPGRQVAIDLWMHDGALLDQVDTAVVYDVVEGEPTWASLRQDQGAVLVEYEWKGSGALRTVDAGLCEESCN